MHHSLVCFNKALDRNRLGTKNQHKSADIYEMASILYYNIVFYCRLYLTYVMLLTQTFIFIPTRPTKFANE